MRWLPRSLSARLFLIVLAGVVSAIALTSSLHHLDRARVFGEYRVRAAVDHLADAVLLLAALPPASRVSAAATLPTEEWFVEAASPAEPILGEAVRVFSQPLKERLGDAVQVDETWLCFEGRASCPYSALVRIRFKDGQALWAGYRPPAPERPERHEWMGLQGRIALFIGIMSMVAWVVVRLALRPLRRLSQAVEDFGRDIAHPPMDDCGPLEVRQAAQAFNAMQGQIRGHMAERMQIVAAVTHDLKTPLTRMRLRLEKCTDEALKDRLQADIDAMQSLVEEGLELARSLDATECLQAVDLDALLQSLCDDAEEAGQDVVYQGMDGQGIVVMGRPNRLIRVFENLIGNAVKYGHYAHVSLERRGGVALVRVRDGGPGIPEESLQEVLKPFVRLEASRSRDTGGTGLGLAIAANLLKAQQGGLSLRNHPEGGLEVSVQLPVSAVPK
jgi:signal transduction histidine kinase